MTVVAAFRMHGVPLLVGDMLITSSLIGEKSSWLATAPFVAKFLPEKLGFRIAGAQKKVHLIGKFLAVSWVGSKLSGATILRAVHEKFSEEIPTKDSFQSFLSSFNDRQAENLSVHLIGWIIDGQPECFRWNSSYPDVVYFDGPQFEGSGEALFAQILDQPVTAGRAGDGLDSPLEQVIYLILAKLTALIQLEISTGITLENRFGYCYDIVFFDGREFQYVSSYTFSSWNLNLDRSGEIQVQMSNLILKYKNFRDYSIVQVSDLRGANGVNTSVDLITPVFDEMKTFDVKQIGRQSVASAFFCSFINMFKDRQKVAETRVVTEQFNHEVFIHEVKDHLDVFSFRTEAVREMFESIGVPGHSQEDRL